jgi:hypothetical protein
MGVQSYLEAQCEYLWEIVFIGDTLIDECCTKQPQFIAVVVGLHRAGANRSKKCFITYYVFSNK